MFLQTEILNIVYKALIVILIAGIGFFGGCSYQSRNTLSNIVAEQKDVIKKTHEMNQEVNKVSGDTEKVKEVIRTVYVPKVVEKVKVEIRDNPIYLDKACVLPQTGIDILNNYADELNKAAKGKQ